MPSSSNHNTAVERHVEELMMVAVVRCISAKMAAREIHLIIALFLRILDRDKAWWEYISKNGDRDMVFTEKGLETRLAVWTRLTDEDLGKKTSRIYEELSWIMTDLFHTLNSVGRPAAAVSCGSLSLVFMTACCDEKAYQNGLQLGFSEEEARALGS